MLTRTALDPSARTRREDLRPVALMILAQADDAGLTIGVTSAQLRRAIRSVVALSPEDEAITPGDTISRFDRSLLNFVSHNVLVNAGVARFRGLLNGHFTITTKGRAEVFDSLLSLVAGELDLPAEELEGSHTAPTGERELHMVGLLALARLQQKNQGAPVAPKDWRAEVRKLVPTSLSDREMTPGSSSNISRFERTLHNFISHRTFTKPGFVVQDAEGNLSITNRGKAALLPSFLPLFPRPAFIDQALMDMRKAEADLHDAQTAVEPEAAPKPRRPHL